MLCGQVCHMLRGQGCHMLRGQGCHAHSYSHVLMLAQLLFYAHTSICTFITKCGSLFSAFSSFPCPRDHERANGCVAGSIIGSTRKRCCSLGPFLIDGSMHVSRTAIELLLSWEKSTLGKRSSCKSALGLGPSERYGFHREL